MATEAAQALVLVGHGSHRDPRSARPVLDHADRVREREVFDEVRSAFWKGEPAPREVLRTLESDAVFVVPFLMSEGYFADRVIPRELRVDDGWELDVDGTVCYTEPVGTHGAMTDAVLGRAEDAAGDPEVGPGVGLAVVGHGTERNPESAASTRHHADRIRDTGRFDEVRALFLDESPRVADLTRRFETTEIVVVPLFVADGPHTTGDVPAAIGLLDDDGGFENPGTVDGRRIRYAGAVGTHAAMADAILERARDAGADVDAGSREPTSSPGFGSVVDALARAASDGVAFDGLEATRGTDGFAFRTPDRGYAGLDEAGFRAVAREHAPFVSNWYYWERAVEGSGTARRAFLRWVERADERAVPERYRALADGATRAWGELAITASAADAGERRYAVRNCADFGTESLASLAGPEAVRDRVRFDDAGRYRPLRGARSLPTGWECTGLDGRKLARAVAHVYPASVANWHRERAGELDVTHYRQAADRHTGIYADVGDLSGADLGRAVESVCGDCVRRRAWDESEGEPIPVGRGGGPIPCREPCSFFVAAARAFLDADDGTGEERDVDERPPAGAFESPENRYRVRYREAKRRRTAGTAGVD